MLITTFGGAVQARTQERVFTSFSRIHDQQHEEEGAEKFQYSVQVGSDGLPGSSALLIPQNDFPLLHRLLGQGHRELRALTAEGMTVAGLGQHAHHTCCFVHVNTHLFPLFILREEKTGDDLKGGKEKKDGRMDTPSGSGPVSKEIHQGRRRGPHSGCGIGQVWPFSEGVRLCLVLGDRRMQSGISFVGGSMYHSSRADIGNGDIVSFPRTGTGNHGRQGQHLQIEAKPPWQVKTSTGTRGTMQDWVSILGGLFFF
jgi:hypothetical protein